MELITLIGELFLSAKEVKPFGLVTILAHTKIDWRILRPPPFLCKIQNLSK